MPYGTTFLHYEQAFPPASPLQRYRELKRQRQGAEPPVSSADYSSAEANGYPKQLAITTSTPIAASPYLNKVRAPIYPLLPAIATQGIAGGAAKAQEDNKPIKIVKAAIFKSGNFGAIAKAKVVITVAVTILLLKLVIKAVKKQNKNIGIQPEN